MAPINSFLFRRFLQTECSSWRWDFKEPVPLQVLSNRIQMKLQANTQYYGRRPFGVGLIVAGYDVGRGFASSTNLPCFSSAMVRTLFAVIPPPRLSNAWLPPLVRVLSRLAPIWKRTWTASRLVGFCWGFYFIARELWYSKSKDGVV